MNEGFQVQNVAEDRRNRLVGKRKNQAKTIQRNRLPKLSLYCKPTGKTSGSGPQDRQVNQFLD